MHLIINVVIALKKIVLFGSHSNPRLCAPIGKNVFIIKKIILMIFCLNDIKKLMDLKKINY